MGATKQYNERAKPNTPHNCLKTYKDLPVSFPALQPYFPMNIIWQLFNWLYVLFLLKSHLQVASSGCQDPIARCRQRLLADLAIKQRCHQYHHLWKVIGIPAGRVVVHQRLGQVVKAGGDNVVGGVIVVLHGGVVVGCEVVARLLVEVGPAGGGVELLPTPGHQTVF